MINILKSCKYCNRIHDSKYDCGKKPARKKEPNDKNKFRWSRKWREKAIDIKERDLYLCLVCKDKGIYNYNQLEVHHIEKLEDNYDLRLNNDNLITLCENHHEEAESGNISKEHLYKLIKKSNES